MFCIRPLCGDTTECGGQMRDKATAVNVGVKPPTHGKHSLVGRSFSSDRLFLGRMHLRDVLVNQHL
jgi:hypothetical protein